MRGWHAGAPVDLAPTKDDPALGADPLRNNDFRYTFPDDQQTQDRCPFAAHLRKTNPRADLEDAHPPPDGIPTDPQRIVRRGIPFGPEVSAAEAASGITTLGRGLLFAAYQASIANGFQFIQQSRQPSLQFLDSHSLRRIRLGEQYQFPAFQTCEYYARLRSHHRPGLRSGIAHTGRHKSQQSRRPASPPRAVGCAERRGIFFLALHLCPQGDFRSRIVLR